MIEDSRSFPQPVVLQRRRVGIDPRVIGGVDTRRLAR
jgi:hypothetical protein